MALPGAVGAMRRNQHPFARQRVEPGMRPRLPVEHTDRPNRSTRESVLRFAREQWGEGVRLFRAPGRVNLIGEHTDYNEGFVLPAAIGFSAWMAARPRNDRCVAVNSRNFDETRSFDLDRLPDQPQRHWSDYVAGVIVTLRQAGFHLTGADLIVAGDVPIGSGLSSSAALETVVAFTLLSLTEADIDRTQVAQLCRQAEQDFVGVRVGIMDQFVSCHAIPGHALLLDCRSLDYRFAPIPAGVSIAICNTMVQHALAGGEYNRRRAECEEGVRLLSQCLPGIHSLRDVTPGELERCKRRLPSVIHRRCRHVIGENRRVLNAVQALEQNDLEAFGRLMYNSHISLQQDYEVSCPELDVMVRLAAELPGVYGARMTGGGFGGCAVALVRDGDVSSFRDRILAAYRDATGIEAAVYVTEAAAGAEEMPPRSF